MGKELGPALGPAQFLCAGGRAGLGCEDILESRRTRKQACVPVPLAQSVALFLLPAPFLLKLLLF